MQLDAIKWVEDVAQINHKQGYEYPLFSDLPSVYCAK